MDAERIQEIFSTFGPVTVRRMFGGAGIYADGTMFGLVDDGVIYLKADDTLIADFKKAECGPFTYATRDGPRVLTSYWQLPDGLYDDPDELTRWARRSFAVAQQHAGRKGGKSKGGKSKGGKKKSR